MADADTRTLYRLYSLNRLVTGPLLPLALGQYFDTALFVTLTISPACTRIHSRAWIGLNLDDTAVPDGHEAI